jgi:hypothetical protein
MVRINPETLRLRGRSSILPVISITFALCAFVCLFGAAGCAKRSGKGNSSKLVGNWETKVWSGGQKKIFYLSEGGTGVVDIIGDNMKPDVIMSWSFDGKNFTYATTTIDHPEAPPLKHTCQCVVSADGNRFRLLTGTKEYDSLPGTEIVSTFYRGAEGSVRLP